MIVSIVLTLLMVLYSVALFFLGYKFKKIQHSHTHKTESFTAFSVIIPFRNEIFHLPGLLQSFQNVNYPYDKLQLIFVDDHSDDLSAKWLHDHVSQLPFQTQIIGNPLDSIGKKAALTTGIENANHHYIFTTDADCELPKDLFQILNSAILEKDPAMLLGPVVYTHNHEHKWHIKYQIFENAGLVAFGALAAQSGNPFLANGANLCFKKSIFYELGGYSGNEFIASGDDEFLLEKFKSKDSKSIVFVMNPNALVKTAAQNDFKSLINQRIRWAGKSRYKRNKTTFLLQILISALYLGFCIYTGYSIFHTEFLPIALLLLGIKLIADLFFLKSIKPFFQLKVNALQLFPISVAQLFISPIVAIGSLRGKFLWKGREVYN